MDKFYSTVTMKPQRISDPFIRARLKAWLQQQDFGAALLTSPFSIDWASCFTPTANRPTSLR